MRTLSLVSSVALLALSCSSAPPPRVSPSAAVGTLSTPVRVRAANLPPGSTFAFGERPAEAPPQLEALVAGLLERRGWRAEPAGGADVLVEVGRGERLDPGRSRGAAARGDDRGGGAAHQMTFNAGPGGSEGDILHREQAGSRSPGIPPPDWAYGAKSLEVQLVSASGGNWSAETWAESPRLVEEPSWLRLVLSLADSLPRASVPSPEAAAMVRLGVDFLALPGSGADGSTLVVLAGVEAGSPAEHAGWRPRDLLVEIGGQPTDQTHWRQIAAWLAAAEREPVAVELLRAGERFRTYLVPVGPRPVT